MGWFEWVWFTPIIFAIIAPILFTYIGLVYNKTPNEVIRISDIYVAIKEWINDGPDDTLGIIFCLFIIPFVGLFMMITIIGAGISIAIEESNKTNEMKSFIGECGKYILMPYTVFTKTVAMLFIFVFRPFKQAIKIIGNIRIG